MWMDPEGSQQTTIIKPSITQEAAITGSRDFSRILPPSVADQFPSFKEILVYLKDHTADTCNQLLGAIFVNDNASISDTQAQICKEIDGAPDEFSILRISGDLIVPVNKGQYEQKTLMHFRNSNTLLLMPPDHIK